ncbi:MAG: hypothetical protein QXN05_05655 [Acidilobaceae archaeon]
MSVKERVKRVKKRIALTREAWESCTATPSHSLIGMIESVEPGEEFEIVGDEEYAPMEAVIRIVTWRWKVELLEARRENGEYLLRFKKVS